MTTKKQKQSNLNLLFAIDRIYNEFIHFKKSSAKILNKKSGKNITLEEKKEINIKKIDIYRNLVRLI